MPFSQPLFNHTFYPQPLQPQTSILSNKISSSPPILLKNQFIQPYQPYQLKNYHLHNLSSPQIHPKPPLKHSPFKPLKNLSTNSSTKFKTQSPQNYTADLPPTNHYPDLLIKRSGSTAPIRKRSGSQKSKENHPNQEEKHTPEPQTKQTLESVSSIFNYTNKSKHLRNSSLVRLKSKPHIIFYSSKLPKDFFGDSLDEDHHGIQYKFIPVNLQQAHQLNSSKKIRYMSSMKTLNQQKDCGSMIKLCLNEKKPEQKLKLIQKTQPEFTFRKQNCRKNIEIFEENTLQTPNFISQIQKTQPLKGQQTPQKIAYKPTASSEPNKKQYRKYSRQFLKL